MIVKAGVPPKRKPSDSQTSVVEDRNASLFEVRLKLGEVGQQEEEVALGRAISKASEEDRGRKSAMAAGQHVRKVHVRGYQNSLLRDRQCLNSLIRHRGQSQLPNVNRVMAVSPQPIDKDRRQCIVGEKLQGVIRGT